jgi:hypothetical protein
MSKDKQLPSLSAQELQEMKNLYADTVVFPSQTVTLCSCTAA